MKRKFTYLRQMLVCSKILIITIMLQFVTISVSSKNLYIPTFFPDSLISRVKSESGFLNKWIDSAFVIGNTIVEPKKSVLEDWLITPSQFTEKGDLNVPNKKLSLIVLGDGLAAGWKDGGLFRDAQQFTFPNLVAHQLGITNFNSPIFDVEHGNGTGFLVREKSSRYPRWKEVKNNLAIKNGYSIPEFVEYQGDEAENLAIPRISTGSVSATLSPENEGWIFDGSGRRYTDDMPFLWRLNAGADKSKITYWGMAQDILKSKQPQLVFSIFGFDEMTQQNIKSENVKMSWSLASSEASPLVISVAELATKNGAKGIVFTIPDFKHLPYFNWYKKMDLDELNSKVQLKRSRIGVIGNLPIRGEMIFLPTKNTEMLFNEAGTAGSAEFPLEDKDVADESEIIGGSSAAINVRIKREAKEKGLLVVDLAALYATIYLEGIKTFDGFIIEPGENSSFFSEDGLYPSTIGHAIIANETIKILNQEFKSKIPLINVSEFADYLK